MRRDGNAMLTDVPKPKKQLAGEQKRAAYTPPPPHLSGGGQVDVVDAHTGPADDPQLIGGGNDLGGHLGARSDHQGVVVANDRGQFGRGQAGADIHLGHLGEDVNPSLVNWIRDKNLGHARRCGEEGAGGAV